MVGHRGVSGNLHARPAFTAVRTDGDPRQAAVALRQEDAAAAIRGELPGEAAAQAARIRVETREGRRRWHVGYAPVAAAFAG